MRSSSVEGQERRQTPFPFLLVILHGVRHAAWPFAAIKGDGRPIGFSADVRPSTKNPLESPLLQFEWSMARPDSNSSLTALSHCIL
jgi:hypothetical protein